MIAARRYQGIKEFVAERVDPILPQRRLPSVGVVPTESCFANHIAALLLVLGTAR
jgi:hypothetical protein